MYYLRIDGVNYPVAPGEIKEEAKNKNEQVTLVTGKEITIAKKPGLESFTLDIRLPRTQQPWAYYEQKRGAKLSSGFNEPEKYAKLLRQLKTEKKHFKLLITKDWERKSKKTGKPIKPKKLSRTVTLEELSFTEAAGEGGDIIATCTFRRWKDHTIMVRKVKGRTVKTTMAKVITSPKKRTYKTKKGDTLKKISKKMYGTQKYASKIYAWNKKAIERAAKKHGKKTSKKGKYLYKGIKLKLKNVEKNR